VRKGACTSARESGRRVSDAAHSLQASPPR
jgi:hypothetical protein